MECGSGPFFGIHCGGQRGMLVILQAPVGCSTQKAFEGMLTICVQRPMPHVKLTGVRMGCNQHLHLL